MGMSSTLAAAGSSTRLVTSSSPGWPAHSKPSTDTAAQPRLWAFREWRTEVHLWITLIPCSLNSGMKGSGLRPAVSTILTPASTITWAYSSYGTGLMVGSRVRLTPNGLSVISLQRAISLARSSGVRCVSPVMMPSAPALDTAAASSA